MPQPPLEKSLDRDASRALTQSDNAVYSTLASDHLSANGHDAPNVAENRLSLEEVVDGCVFALRRRLLEDLSGLLDHAQAWSAPKEQSISSPDCRTTEKNMRGSKKQKNETHVSLSDETSLELYLDADKDIARDEGALDLDVRCSLSSSKHDSNRFDAFVSCLSEKSASSSRVVSLWPVWFLDGASRECSSEGSVARATSGRAFLNGHIIRTGDTIRHKGWCQWVILRPTSTVRILWDVLSCLLMAYDILLVPMMVFDLPEDTFLRTMALLIASFWTTDLVFTFFVGFHDGGIVEMRPKNIAVRYLRTWFLLDFIVVCCDWFSLAQVVSADSIAAVRTSKALKVVRVFRLMRFLRIWSIVSMLSEISDFINTDNLVQMMGILKFIVAIVIVNHYVACTWYAIAEFYPGGTQTTWIGELDRKHDNPSVLFQYATSLHWSFTQFTPASMEVVARNGLERIFSVIVLLSGLVVFSSFVSGITSAMTRVRENNKERNRQESALRRYIVDNKVSLELSRRVYSYLKARRVLQRTRILEDEVAVFRMLPPHILMDIHAEVFLPILSRHPFFYQFLFVDEPGLVDVCHEAVAEFALIKGQLVFMRDQHASRMVVNTEGSLAYIQENSPPQEIEESTIFGEVVLWLRWQHRARLEATNCCVLLELRAEDFHKTVLKTASFKSCQRYAQQFAQQFGGWVRKSEASSPASNTCVVDAASFSDLWQEFDIVQEMAQVAFELQLEQQLEEAQTISFPAGKLKFSWGKLAGSSSKHRLKVPRSGRRLSRKG